MTATKIISETPPGKKDFAQELSENLSRETLIRRDEPMAKHTTLRVGGPADFYIEPANENDLAAILKFCSLRNVRFFVLGRGSNLLVRDGGFRGVVICLAQPYFCKIEIVGQASSLSDRQDACPTIHCGAGAKLKNLAVEGKRNHLSGVEFLEGIPGSVGGALRMNAGAMGRQTFDVIESVRVMDFAGEISQLTPEKMIVEYRSCATLKNHVALGAIFKCKIASREDIEKRMRGFAEKRWASQPAAPSAGCLFKNPATIPAGKLIDELGLKNTRVGGARISDEHGNFLVNDGKASAHDVLELIEILKAKAKAERGIELRTEVEIIGEDNQNTTKMVFA